MKMPTVMKSSHAFSRVPQAEIQRSSFDRSHGYKTTFDSGLLIPVFVDEVLPGDTFNLRATMFARLATPLKPLMDNLYLDSFFFFVPNRLVWDNWVRFMGEQDNPTDSVAFTVPVMTSPGGGYQPKSIHDYFGLPTFKQGYTHISLWHRAYNLIWNQWFRDQNLQNSVLVRKTDTGDVPSDFTLLRRGKRHDYFTSCLPFPQKGPSVSIPLGTSAPVTIPTFGISVTGITRTGGAGAPENLGHIKVDSTTAANNLSSGVTPSDAPAVDDADLTGSVSGVTGTANLATATAATINALRQAFQLQRLYERDARGGTRYTELNRSHFGVISPDARLQRPEYLGGGSTPISITPVAQTSVTAATPQGNLAAFGTVTAHGHGFTKSFTEHGMLIGLVSVRADLTYQQGMWRMWNRSTRPDYYFPALAHLGEQAVLNKEIDTETPAGTDDLVFGYQERFAEYRYKPSVITGLFRSNTGASLDVWHLSQQFGSLPVLGPTFIEEHPPIQRVIAVPGQDELIFDSYFQLTCVRPMPVYSVPGLIDHF